jgi:hypothetical protein
MGVEVLHEELDRLAAADLSGDPAVLGAEVLELRRVAERAIAQASRRLRPFEAKEGYLDSGQASAKGWLRTQTLSSHGEAAAAVSVARIDGLLAELFTAWRAGETTFDHIRQVEINLRKLPEELWAEVDAELTEKARTLTVKDFGCWLRELAQSLGDEPKPRDETQHESRRLSLSVGFNGMYNLVGRLTPEQAEKLSAGTSAASRPDAAGEVRSRGQRLADALESLVDTALNSDLLPGDGGQRPHLNLDVDLDHITEQAQRDEENSRRPVNWWSLTDTERAERIAQGLADADAATDPASGRPRFYWTGPASVSAARRLACDAVVLPIFTRNGAPIDVGRTYRLVSAAQRKLIEKRDRHCQWKRCTVGGRWCVVHHVQFWRDGGPTDRWNELLLCPEHHRAAHDGRFTIVLHAPGKISTRPRRNSADPYYELRLKAPPPPEITLMEKLQTAAGFAQSAQGQD